MYALIYIHNINDVMNNNFRVVALRLTFLLLGHTKIVLFLFLSIFSVPHLFSKFISKNIVIRYVVKPETNWFEIIKQMNVLFIFPEYLTIYFTLIRYLTLYLLIFNMLLYYIYFFKLIIGLKWSIFD